MFREPRRPPTLTIEIEGRPLRIHVPRVKHMRADERGWPKINGFRLTERDLRRGWCRLY